MHSGQSLIAELESAVAKGSPEQRVSTLRRVTDLFLNGADRFDEQQVGLFDDVLLHLVQGIEVRALAELSTTLATVDGAPSGVVRRLAYDDDITVAGPVLTHSRQLSGEDLTKIAQTKGQSHLVALSGRSMLDEGLTDILIDRGNGDVTRTLARNNGARFSPSGFQNLVVRAEKDETLAESLGVRLDLPEQMFDRLMLQATEVVRARIMAAAPAEAKSRIESVLSNVSGRIAKQVAAPRDYKRAEALVAAMQRRDELNEEAIVQFLKDSKIDEVVAAIALICSAPIATVDRLLRDPKHDGVLLLCRAAELKWQTAVLILKTRFSHSSISDHDITRDRSSFLTLSTNTARRGLRFMQTQASVQAH